MHGNFLQDALIYLGTALVFVPLAKKLGIGSVLGYLLGGIAVGPFLLGLIGTEGEDVMHAAEFGVVMMLFLVGLELNPKTFWKMRHFVVGMGGLQMVLTTVLLWPILYAGFGLTAQAALAVAIALSMSSTAIVLQTLKEKSLDKTQSGESSFSVLLFQDIAVIPILALLPFLAAQSVSEVEESHLPAFLHFLEAQPTLLLAVAVGIVFLISRFLVSPILHVIAKLHSRELFTAFALFLVIGISWMMEMAGISAALGAFMAGVLLANSEFRHELESDITPFKGLLLGVFFVAVGSTINFTIIAEYKVQIAMAVGGVMVVKWIVLFGLGKFFGLVSDQKLWFAFLLSQVGEFAFVLLGTTHQLTIIDAETLAFFMAVATISMLLSPLLLVVHERFIVPRFGVKEDVGQARAADSIDAQHKIILVGFGHFGSTLGRFLKANQVAATIIDNDSDRVLLLRKMGFVVYYGDGTRLDLLEAAGAGEATALISAIDDAEKNAELAELVQKHFPNAELFVRAKNRYDAYELMDKGIRHIFRESLTDSVFMGVEVLSFLGMRKYTLVRKALDFVKYDERALAKLVTLRHDQSTYIHSIREEIEFQEKMLLEDIIFMEDRKDNAWDASNR